MNVRDLLPLFSLFFIATITSCDSKKDLEPSIAVQQIVGDDLQSWLASAPFDNLWDPAKNNEGAYVMTNIDQVFPFIGKYKDAAGSFGLMAANSELVYDKKTTVFKDTNFGESVVHAILLYDYQPLYLPSGMSEGSNIIFDGTTNLNQRYYADLQETKSINVQPKEKAILYWISSNNARYLSGFYQKDQLAFQFAFPFKDTFTSINKIKQINTQMKLNVTPWASLTKEQLAINNNPISFWKDPFVGLYREKFLPNLQLKLKDTDYEIKTDKVDGYDYAFAKAQPTSTLYIKTITTDLTNLDYQNQMESKNYEIVHNEYQDPIYIIEDSLTTIKARTYFKDEKILELSATFVKIDKTTKEEFLIILRYIRIKKY